jgi:hypothetical protein
VPFTLAHAAAAFPLRRTRLVLSALIVGTFAPDLEFFLRFGTKSHFGHTLAGLFLFSLPVGFAVFWLFHAFVKEPLAALMPTAVRQRITAGIYPISLREPLQLGLVLVSILVGEATHMLWDSFTHDRYWPYRHLPLLKQKLAIPGLGPMHYYKLFQYGSTVIGCIAVCVWFVHWLRTAPLQQHPPGDQVPAAQVRFARIAIPVVALLGALVRAQLGAPLLPNPHRAEIWLTDFSVTAITLVWFEFLVWGLMLPRFTNRDLPPATPAR